MPRDMSGAVRVHVSSPLRPVREFHDDMNVWPDMGVVHTVGRGAIAGAEAARSRLGPQGAAGPEGVHADGAPSRRRRKIL